MSVYGLSSTSITRLALVTRRRLLRPPAGPYFTVAHIAYACTGTCSCWVREYAGYHCTHQPPPLLWVGELELISISIEPPFGRPPPLSSTVPLGQLTLHD